MEATNRATLKNETTSSGYTIDLTAPRVHYVKDHPHDLHYQASDDQMYAAWLFDDPESGIVEYKYRVLGEYIDSRYSSSRIGAATFCSR